MKLKQAVSLVILALVFFLPSCQGPPQVQDELTVISSSAQADFPATLSFTISAGSDVDITEIRLHYKVLYSGFSDVTSEAYLEFSPAKNVTASWDWDMRRTGGLPPGVDVRYWWTVRDTSGDTVETTPDTVPFNDERFSWHDLEQGLVTVRWYRGGQAFGEEVMQTVQEALEWLLADTGAALQEPIEIYLYATAQDLQGSMIFPQEWTGGVTFSRYKRIAIGISPDNLDWGKRALAHELTHMVVHQMTNSPYGGMPVWLDEGLAMRSEGELDSVFANYLNWAIEDDTLISVQSLSSPFSALSHLSYLSYAESYSIVDYLISTYGKDKMLELLETFREGASYDGALEKVYGFNTSGLDRLWRASLSVPDEIVSRTGAVQ